MYRTTMSSPMWLLFPDLSDMRDKKILKQAVIHNISYASYTSYICRVIIMCQELNRRGGLKLKKILNQVCWCVCIICISFSTYAGSSLELKDPRPVSFIEVDDIDIVKRAIKASIKQEDWQLKNVISQDPHIVEVELLQRKHSITVRLEYDLSSVKFSYVDSENMNYKEKRGKRYIHKNYNAWIRELARAIRNNIGYGSAQVSNSQPRINASQNGIAGTNVSVGDQEIRKNPPPAEPFSNFTNFEIEPVTLGVAFQHNDGNKHVLLDFDRNLKERISPYLFDWVTNPEGRTLVIRPKIEAIKYLGVKARAWSRIGSGDAKFFGSSWVYLRVMFVDKASGKVIGAPDLFRTTGADEIGDIGGVRMFVPTKRAIIGVVQDTVKTTRKDKHIIVRIADDVVGFLDDNYFNAVGGGIRPDGFLVREAKKLNFEKRNELKKKEKINEL